MQHSISHTSTYLSIYLSIYSVQFHIYPPIFRFIYACIYVSKENHDDDTHHAICHHISWKIPLPSNRICPFLDSQVHTSTYKLLLKIEMTSHLRVQKRLFFCVLWFGVFWSFPGLPSVCVHPLHSHTSGLGSSSWHISRGDVAHIWNFQFHMYLSVWLSIYECMYVSEERSSWWHIWNVQFHVSI